MRVSHYFNHYFAKLVEFVVRVAASFRFFGNVRELERDSSPRVRSIRGRVGRAPGAVLSVLTSRVPPFLRSPSTSRRIKQIDEKQVEQSE